VQGDRSAQGGVLEDLNATTKSLVPAS